MTVLTVAAVTALALAPACGSAGPDSDFARRLVATAQAESGLDPYIIHINGSPGGSRHYATEQDAITAARALDAAGVDFDAGLMQVNRRQFAHHGLTLSIGSVFDGCTSMRAGADHLADDVSSVWDLASRRYNCGGITCGAAYARRVDALVSRVGAAAGPPLSPSLPPCAPAWDAWAIATCSTAPGKHHGN
jgi:soluble lytic murein transglycosylase-like protein